jgi:phosphatidylethanolamine/phosphatidyl-N-methylethanolamine N-methyltransferase
MNFTLNSNNTSTDGLGDLPHESKLYHQFCRIYEPVFNRFFARRARATIRSLNLPRGARVLEVGAGTGSSFSAYPPEVNVTGIDLSPSMLALAKEKVAANNWHHITLRRMDALNLEFSNASFDYVFAFHVVSVVPDHRRLISEMTRVCKPSGTIAIINHFRSENRLIASLVDKLDAATRKLGWSTKLRVSDLTDDAPLTVNRRFKTSRRSLFTVVVATRDGIAVNGQAAKGCGPNGQANIAVQVPHAARDNRQLSSLRD